MNFGYAEHGQRKNALIKVRKYFCKYVCISKEDYHFLEIISGLCPDCSRKLNYHSKKREIKKLKKLCKKSTKKRSIRHLSDDELLAVESSSQPVGHNDVVEEDVEVEVAPASDETAVWSTDRKQQDSSAGNSQEQKSREEEFDDYLEDLLL